MAKTESTRSRPRRSEAGSIAPTPDSHVSAASAVGIKRSQLSIQQVMAGLKSEPTRQDLIHGLFGARAAINLVAGELNQRGGFDTDQATVLLHMALFQVEQAAIELRDRPQDLLS
ncbi:MAG: hypothetical protein ACRD3Q_17575 [Terriglobales bacterium]